MRSLLTFLRPSRGWLSATVLCLTVAAVFESVGLSLFVPLITMLAQGSDLPGTGGSALFASYGRFLESVSRSHGVQIIVTALCMTLVLKNLFAYAGRLLGAYVELRTVRALRTRLFETYLGSSYQFFLDRKPGRLVHDLFTETALVGETVGICTVSLSNLVTIAAFYLLLLLLSWPVTLVASVLFVLLTIGLQSLSGLSKRVGALRQRIVRDFVAFGTELILGVRQVMMFGAEERVAARFRESAHRLSRVNLRAQAISLSVEPLSELVALLVMVGLVVMASRGIMGTAGTRVSVLITFTVVLVRLLPIVGSLNKQLIRLRANTKSVTAITELLAKAPKPGVQRRGWAFTELRDAIRFDEVEFSYPGRPQAPVLQRVTLSFPKGRTTAIVGPSGAGKSTLIDLVARLYQPSLGRVTADGVNLQECDLASWRRAIGFVSQDTFIFSTTVRDNIVFASADVSGDDVLWAAQQADAHKFITELPEGYDTLVGDRGLKLSGGQRQRIAIARAILRRPQILIFDEATSALDRESEQRVQQAIRRVSRDRTVIIVAHRLSTVIGADQIIVLDQGRIAEQGTHEALMARGGVYWKLYHAEGSRPRRAGRAVEADRLVGITP